MARIKIDASALASFNYETFLEEYFQPTGEGGGSATWLDATAIEGTNFFYPADQYGVRFAGTVNDRQILVEGEDMGYDVTGFHTYYGDIDAIRFAYYNAETTYAQGNGQRSEMVGALEGLVVSGLDISVPKATSEEEAEELASNAFYDLYNMLRHTNGTLETYIDDLYDLFATKAQRFTGTDGDDVYTGTKFGDRIDGGAGFDTLAGGKGKDVFIFELGDSTETADGADLILDFNNNKDRINLRQIDANENKDGDQSFKFIGKDDFSGKARELRFERDGDSTHVFMDVDGDGLSDMAITLEGGMRLQANDFLL